MAFIKTQKQLLLAGPLAVAAAAFTVTACAGGGGAALWLAHPARTTQPSAAATNRAGVALRQARSVIPTVLGMTPLHQLR